MSVSEFDRHQLFRYFEDTMGPERAATMMEVLTPVNWTELATKSDLATMATKSDLATMATKSDIADMATKSDIADLATKSDLATVGAELRAEFKHDLAQHTRLLFFGMLASQATLVGLVFAVVQFGSG